MDEHSQVTNGEIIRYLQIAYGVLKAAESSVDLDRLKVVMEILKKEEKNLHQAPARKASYKIDNIINLLEKQKQGIPWSEEEWKAYDAFRRGNPFMDAAQGKDYEKLYGILNDPEHDFTAGELSVLYYCLYQERTRQKKKTDIMRGISAYIEQNLYFDHMDLEYKKDGGGTGENPGTEGSPKRP